MGWKKLILFGSRARNEATEDSDRYYPLVQIPTHDGHPCSWLYTSRYRACYGLAPIRECSCWANRKKAATLPRNRLKSSVEIVGVEPTTLCLQGRCSSQLSYTPEKKLIKPVVPSRLELLTPTLSV